MEKEFTKSKQALALRELRFEEPCLGYYVGKDREVYVSNEDVMAPFGPDLDSKVMFRAPTYSQAFRWFREKHNLHSYIEGAYPWFRYYINSDDDRWEGFKHLTHEEAEQACLDELIEIVKNKKD